MRDKIGNVYRDHKMMVKFALLNDSESMAEFEDHRKYFIDANNLQSNRWLKEMYKIKFNWCPRFMREHFLLE